MVTRTQIIDVRPVCYYHSIPVKVFFQPFGQKLPVGMEGQTIVNPGIDHYTKCTVTNSSQERSKMLFPHITAGNGRRSTVLSGYRYTITHIMLHTGSYIICSDMIRIIALKTRNSGLTHFSIHITILSIILPHTRPTRVSSQINNRRVSPRNTTGLGFIRRNFRSFPCQFPIESGSHIDTLGKHGSPQRIRCSMDLVYSINAGDSNLLHGNILNYFDGLCPFFFLLRHT